MLPARIFHEHNRNFLPVPCLLHPQTGCSSSLLKKKMTDTTNFLRTNQFPMLASPKGTMDFVSSHRRPSPLQEEQERARACATTQTSSTSLSPSRQTTASDFPVIRLQRRFKDDIVTAQSDGRGSPSWELPNRVLFPLKFWLVVHCVGMIFSLCNHYI